MTVDRWGSGVTVNPNRSLFIGLPYAKGEEGVASKAGDIWLASAAVSPRQQRLQAPSDIGGSGGAPRRATAGQTEARSVADSLARIVNTEGPRP